jgi:septal ring-binding cell division protein DamX
VKAQPIKKPLTRVKAETKAAAKAEPKRVVSTVDKTPPAAPSIREIRPVKVKTEAKATEQKAEIVTSKVGKSSFVEDALPAREIPPAEEMRPAGDFTINVASFKEEERANLYVEVLQEKGLDAFQWDFTLPGGGTWYRVSVGAFPTRQEAKDYMEELEHKGIHNTFVARIPETP